MRIWLLNIALVLMGGVFGQNPERKIIIKNGKYYYLTINDNHQLATYYVGNVTEPIAKAEKYVLPMARNLTSQLNPLAWDFYGDSLVAINFMDHVLNDRYESIKKIGLSNLVPLTTDFDIRAVVDAAIDQPQYIFNQPYLSVKEKSDILSHFYFDLCMIGEDLWMVMSNEGRYRIWKYSAGEWKMSKIYQYELQAYFSLINENGKPIMLTANGEKISLSLDGIESLSLAKPNFELKDYSIVVDQDTKKNYYIKNNLITPQQSLKEILEKDGVLL